MKPQQFQTMVSVWISLW